MWPKGVEHQMHAHQINDNKFNFSLVMMDDVSMNPGSGPKIFTSRIKESLGQLRNFLFQQSSFHLKHTREIREGYDGGVDRAAAR
jgi:hypothetical protein